MKPKNTSYKTYKHN